MSAQHTPEPWEISCADETVVITEYESDRSFVASTLAFDSEIADAQDYANARRIVACVNACAGISTENLENNKPLKEGLRVLNQRIREAEQQRDELLAAAELALKVANHPPVDRAIHDILAPAIDKVRGQQQ